MRPPIPVLVASRYTKKFLDLSFPKSLIRFQICPSIWLGMPPVQWVSLSVTFLSLISLGGSKLRLLLPTHKKQHTCRSPSIHLLFAFRSSPARHPLISCSPSAHLLLDFCSPSAPLLLAFRSFPASFLLSTLTNCPTINHRLPLFNQFIVSDENSFR